MSNNQPSVKDSFNHIVCFVALPFNDNDKFAYKTVLLPALRLVLEQSPYYWQVVRADDTIFASTISENIADWMQLASVGIADISDLNPNVMMELGYMYWRKPILPLFVLERIGTGHHLSDLAGIIRVTYSNVAYNNDSTSKNHAITDIAKFLKVEFAKRQDIIKNLKPTKPHHYLSPLVVSQVCAVDDQIAFAYAEVYKTMEVFVSVDAKSLSRELHTQKDVYLNPTIIVAHQRVIKNLLSKL